MSMDIRRPGSWPGVAFLFATIATPALAEQAPKSEAGTAFMQRCIADLTAHRIGTLKKQMPEYAESLSAEELNAGGMAKAQSACPCFLQVIAVDPAVASGTPETRVADFVAYLDSVDTDQPKHMPQTLMRLTRSCGERGSVLPPSWFGR